MGMRPKDSKESGEEGELDSWVALRKSTDEARANLIADIVGHPKGAPSVAELDYMNPSLGEDAIRNHLQELREAGVIEELVVETGNRVRGYPYKFYRITDEARKLFDKNNLFPEESWQRQYNRVEKTTEIREMEGMSRPSLATGETDEDR
jgi:DNA-binding transcriptional ArsR family regulator